MKGGKLVLLLAATAVLSAAAGALAFHLVTGGSPSPAPGGKTLDSGILGERRPYAVHLPQGYAASPAARYPVLYVLDGEWQGEQSAASVSLLARIGVIPPTIVVTIPNLSEDTRARDFAASSKFLSFLEKELIPEIEAGYRTARPRILAGWSLSGRYVLHTQSAAPDLFDARLAHSPFVWNEEDAVAVAEFEQGLATPASGFLYLSLGEQETQTAEPFQRAVRALESHAPATLRWRADHSAGGTHESNPRLSSPVGLCAAFAADPGQACRPAS